MKVLCLIDTLGAAGAQRQIIGLSALLKEKGYDVMLSWYHNKPYDKKELEQANIKTYNVVKHSSISKFMVVYNTIKMFKPDVIIAYIDGPTIITSLLKLLGGKFKLIVSERNTNIKISKKQYLKFFLYRWADYIVPNSYSQANFIENKFPHLYSKTKVITNFTDTKKFVPLKNRTYENKRVHFLIVARIVEQKNVLGLIKTVKLLADMGYDFKVTWYGKPFYQSYYDKCQSLIHTLCLEDYFQFHDVSFNIVEVYNEADVFCLPSYREGYPNVVCEAMSCSLPILCSNVCDNSTIIQDGVNGFLFDPYDEKDMCRVLAKFINLSPKQKRAMSIKSRELAENKFSKEDFVNKYISLF